MTPLLKWPNDVLIHGKKISGILCEITETDERVYGVLGIAINVNSTEKFFAGLDLPATSLHDELDQNRLSENIKSEKFGVDIRGFMIRKFAIIPIHVQPVLT